MSAAPDSSSFGLVGGWMRYLLVVFLGLALGSAQAGSWTGTLQDGGVLKVDPSSHRPMLYHNGGVTPLWNGTHTLENGSVVIVRDGQIVPTESMINSWAGEPGSEPTMSERYCDQLVRKVCGFHDECAQSQPCVLARQLLSMEHEQHRYTIPGAGGAQSRTPSNSECEHALSNAAFPACAASVPPAQETPCRKLVRKVCGASDKCNASEACDPARQLLQMESEERLQSADPDAQTSTGAECEKAMDNAFFKPCQ